MIKVITYGTYDMLHYGHIRLLKRAKALGDYLIVGVTAADFDKLRGKINVQQSLEERIEAIRETRIADKIIVEEYEGQKIDDIKRYDVDIFTVGSDWEGYFDYLNEYCKVVYLPRTKGVSSTEIRAEKLSIKLGILGYSPFLNKFFRESKYVDGVDVVGICSCDQTEIKEVVDNVNFITSNYNELLEKVDVVYIHSHPKNHYQEIKYAISKKVHVLCESPVALNKEQCKEIIELANKNNCIFMEAIRTAYITAYSRLLLLLKTGKIGDIVSVEATCTSLNKNEKIRKELKWGAMEAWGPTALLPVFQILGTNYVEKNVFFLMEKDNDIDIFDKINFNYKEATASIKVGTGVKAEGELIIAGTKGYAYVPAPWWKTDYFELRFENPADNKRYFYQVEGEGIRYELVALKNAIINGKPDFYISRDITMEIANIMNIFSKSNCLYKEEKK